MPRKRLGLLVSLFVLAMGGAVLATQIVGQRNRALPSGGADATTGIARMAKYLELFVVPITSGLYGLADEGTYFHAMTTTPGTAYTLTGATQTAFVATTPTFTAKNNDGENAKRMYVDFIRVTFATAGTGGTRLEGAVVVDNTTRYSSGGTALTVANVNMDAATATIATQAFGGAITAAAASGSVRYHCRFGLKTAIPTAGDAVLVSFGGHVATSSTTLSAMCPPAVLGGGDSVLLYLWLPAQTAAPTGEVSAGWWER